MKDDLFTVICQGMSATVGLLLIGTVFGDLVFGDSGAKIGFVAAFILCFPLSWLFPFDSGVK